MLIREIAVIRTPFKEKFGIPRQASLVNEAKGTIIFDPAFSPREALKGIEQYSHLWILWEFSANKDVKYSPAVRPPRLGGNEKIGVFASRSPYRPNPIGLSLVKLEEVRGDTLIVSGVDMLDETPIIDVKPYIPYADRPINARGGFAEEKKDYVLTVENAEVLDGIFTAEEKALIIKVISEDPRPSYQDDPTRIYGVYLFGKNVRFKVSDGIAYIVEAT